MSAYSPGFKPQLCHLCASHRMSWMAAAIWFKRSGKTPAPLAELRAVCARWRGVSARVDWSFGLHMHGVRGVRCPEPGARRLPLWKVAPLRALPSPGVGWPCQGRRGAPPRRRATAALPGALHSRRPGRRLAGHDPRRLARHGFRRGAHSPGQPPPGLDAPGAGGPRRAPALGPLGGAVAPPRGRTRGAHGRGPGRHCDGAQAGGPLGGLPGRRGPAPVLAGLPWCRAGAPCRDTRAAEAVYGGVCRVAPGRRAPVCAARDLLAPGTPEDFTRLDAFWAGL